MSYVDGVIIAVPNENKDAYFEMARAMTRAFKDNGATRVVECWGDDVPDGKLTSFPLAVQKTEDEGIVFSWIEWPSKTVRDEGMPKAMEAMEKIGQNMSEMFDGKRMIFGGFEVMVDETA